MKLNFSRGFHASRRLFGRWTEAEDKIILDTYEELGPAWTVLAFKVNSRSPVECRRRWLTLTNALTDLSPEERRLVYEDGYEFHNGRLIKIPMENIVASPFAKMAAAVEPARFRGQRKREGWSLMERMALREGFETVGAQWNLIAEKIQFRTGVQCRNMMQRQFIGYNQHLLGDLLTLKGDDSKQEVVKETSINPE